MNGLPAAAVLTIGTELTTGLRLDTNGAEVVRELTAAGYSVRAMLSLPDEVALVGSALKALIAAHSLVVVTGGLGPTHDDVTREATASALGRGIRRDQSIVETLRDLAARHDLDASREQMLRQADVVDGATVLKAVAGTAPGQVIVEGDCTLVLLPGPPHEMRPLLQRFLADRSGGPPPVRLRCTGITESDAQHLVQPAIEGLHVDLTLLAAPGEVEVVLFAADGDARDLPAATAAARAALGTYCYSDDGASLPETVLRIARARSEVIACAESCTGGMIAAALTDVPGSSDAFAGGVIAYANEVKAGLLEVPAGLLARHGAVSEATARAMAEGALRIPGATIAIATTGVAGPGGGTGEKPVGLVWLAVARRGGDTTAASHRFGGERSAVRRRATATALDMLRRRFAED